MGVKQSRFAASISLLDLLNRQKPDVHWANSEYGLNNLPDFNAELLATVSASIPAAETVGAGWPYLNMAEVAASYNLRASLSSETFINESWDDFGNASGNKDYLLLIKLDKKGYIFYRGETLGDEYQTYDSDPSDDIWADLPLVFECISVGDDGGIYTDNEQQYLRILPCGPNGTLLGQRVNVYKKIGEGEYITELEGGVIIFHKNKADTDGNYYTYLKVSKEHAFGFACEDKTNSLSVGAGETLAIELYQNHIIFGDMAVIKVTNLSTVQIFNPWANDELDVQAHVYVISDQTHGA